MIVIELEIAGTKVRALELSGRTALSELFRFRVRATIGGDAPAPVDMLGATFKLTLGDPFEQTLVARGVVTEVERVAAKEGGTYVFTLEPAVAPLTIGRDSRVFQDMSVVDIVKKVLETAGIEASTTRWSVTGDYPKHVYRTQHREHDWAFVTRLLSEEGIYFWFDFTDDETVLVFADDSTQAPPIAGDQVMPVHDDAEMHSTRDSVIRVGLRGAIAPEAVRLTDYNFDKPRLALDSLAGSGAHEIYDYPGRFEVPADGDRLARVRLESLRARTLVAFGESGSMRLRPGLSFELSDHVSTAVDGDYVVDAIDYEASQHIETRWSAIPLATPFRAPRIEATSGAGGFQTGVVVGAPGEEIHPDKSGRVRVQFYWDREGKNDDAASTWMRVGQFALGGSMILPRIGWEVLVEHHEGDIDAPVVLTHLYDGQFPVPYALPANKTRTAFQTATTPGGGSANEIRFEDKKGSEEMFVNACG